jgi:hypothetical protein
MSMSERQRRPAAGEAAPYYFKYIDKIADADVLGALRSQLEETPASLAGVSEERSLHRYEPGKWTMRQVVNHVNDVERLFLFRAFWFARGFDSPLPSFDEKASAESAGANDVAWARHVGEMRAIRLSTLSFFENLPAEAWSRSGVASENPFTVRACAFIVAGHAAHHLAILEERYL